MAQVIKINGIPISGGNGDTTRISNGINTYTGGTDNLPSVNISGATLDNLVVSGSTDLGAVSATTIVSGTTDLSSVFAPISVVDTTDVTRISNGINTFTGGTDNIPTVNITGVSLDNFSVSGSAVVNSFSATTFSGNTIYSGGTDLSALFAPFGGGSGTIITGVTVGTGSTLFQQVSGDSMVFRSFSAGTNVRITQENNYVTINATEQISGGTANFSVIEVDYDYLIQSNDTIIGVNTLSSPIIITLPDSAQVGQKTIFIKDSRANSSNNSITVSASTTDTIVDINTGQTTTVLNNNGISIQMTSTGSGIWWLI